MHLDFWLSNQYQSLWEPSVYCSSCITCPNHVVSLVVPEQLNQGMVDLFCVSITILDGMLDSSMFGSFFGCYSFCCGAFGSVHPFWAWLRYSCLDRRGTPKVLVYHLIQWGFYHSNMLDPRFFFFMLAGDAVLTFRSSWGMLEWAYSGSREPIVLSLPDTSYSRHVCPRK